MHNIRRHAIAAMAAVLGASLQGAPLSAAADTAACAAGPSQAVNLSGCGEGDVVTLHGVNFALDEGALDINAQALLSPVADELVSRPDLRVEIGGHTDALGSAEYNLGLSAQRAQAAAQAEGALRRAAHRGRMERRRPSTQHHHQGRRAYRLGV